MAKIIVNKSFHDKGQITRLVSFIFNSSCKESRRYLAHINATHSHLLGARNALTCDMQSAVSLFSILN